MAGLTPKELVAKGEHEQEYGGYFVVKGHERILRMLSATRKNYPITVERDIWKRRGKMFSSKGVFIRCVKEDMTSTNNVLHYISNGTMKLMLSFRKGLFFFPIILVMKALVNCTDSYIYEQLVQGLEDNIYFKDRIALMLRQVQDEGLFTYAHARNYIGRNFRAQFKELPDW